MVYSYRRKQEIRPLLKALDMSGTNHLTTQTLEWPDV